MFKKALILAAGKSTRLNPLTDTIPKPMLPVGGRPVIEYAIRRLLRFGVQHIVINLHHCPGAVHDHFGDGSSLGVHITYSYEPVLLGTAGALKPVSSFFKDAPFFIYYGDNLTTCDLAQLTRVHQKKRGLATIALFWKEGVSPHSAVALLPDMQIVKFVEKPKPGEEPSKWLSAGVFILEPRIMDYIPEHQYCDFGFHLFPTVLQHHEKIFGYFMTEKELLFGIDTPEKYWQACELWKNGFPC
jgi:NDP-sugar pyrophosphorylase family protein